MKQSSNSNCPPRCSPARRGRTGFAAGGWAAVLAGLLTGCASQPLISDGEMTPETATSAAPEPISLREGDLLRVSFPGSPSLDTTQQVRRDGKIALPLIGEVDAAGSTSSALAERLTGLYASRLPSKQVVVAVVSSSFPVYVTGMVMHPGKIMSDHPISTIEAVMEAGGFDYSKANLKAVTVMRRENNLMKNYKLNLKVVLAGQQSELFELKPNDIVYVPERFAVF